MTTARVETEGQTIELDASGLENRLNKNIDAKMEQYKAELKTYKEQQEAKRGKGVIEYLKPDRKKQIIESIKDSKVLKEQWTITIPSITLYEPAAHLRDYVFVTDIIKGSAGDTVNIPYVKDLDFETLAAVGNAFAAATTGLVNVLTTTLKEAGAWSDIAYEDIEKIDHNLLDELNRVFAHAAVRAEDKALVALLDAGTTSQFGLGDNGGKMYWQVGDWAMALFDTHMKASWIADAIGLMLAKGKEVHPGDCVVYMTGIAYQSMLRELAASQVIAYARSDVIQKGLVEDYLGVRILVGGHESRTFNGSGVGAGGTSYQCAYLMRAKRCLALAPKRDILIETDRIIATRKLRITGSHTFGVCLLDMTEAVQIHTGQPGLAT